MDRRVLTVGSKGHGVNLGTSWQLKCIENLVAEVDCGSYHAIVKASDKYFGINRVDYLTYYFRGGAVQLRAWIKILIYLICLKECIGLRVSVFNFRYGLLEALVEIFFLNKVEEQAGIDL